MNDIYVYFEIKSFLLHSLLTASSYKVNVMPLTSWQRFKGISLLSRSRIMPLSMTEPLRKHGLSNYV